MVSNRLYTDIAMANRAGGVGILVLSGEATMEDVALLEETAEQFPDLIVDSVRFVVGLNMSLLKRISGLSNAGKISSRRHPSCGRVSRNALWLSCLELVGKATSW